MKVLLLTNVPAPYKIDFFNEWGKHCDLAVAFEGKTALDRDSSWYGNKHENFQVADIPEWGV